MLNPVVLRLLHTAATEKSQLYFSNSELEMVITGTVSLIDPMFEYNDFAKPCSRSGHQYLVSFDFWREKSESTNLNDKV